MTSKKLKHEVMRENLAVDDCGVACIQALAGCSRSVALRLAKRYGYKDDGSGMLWADVIRAVERASGKLLHRIDVPYNASVATFSMTHEYGSYMLCVEDHMMALVEGDVFNAGQLGQEWGRPLLAVYRLGSGH